MNSNEIRNEALEVLNRLQSARQHNFEAQNERYIERMTLLPRWAAKCVAALMVTDKARSISSDRILSGSRYWTIFNSEERNLRKAIESADQQLKKGEPIKNDVLQDLQLGISLINQQLEHDSGPTKTSGNFFYAN